MLDLGTSNTKATLFSENGSTVFESAVPTPTLFDAEAMEIDQNRLWSDIRGLISRAAAALSAGDRIAAVTLSSMACTMIPLDGDGNSLHNALSWLEKRPYEKYTRPFLNRFAAGYSIPKCGQYPLNMYPAFKIPWFRDEFPEETKKVRKWVNISDFIHSKLLGTTEKYYCDYSIASRSMLFDDQLKTWNKYALEEFSIEECLLPVPLPTGSVLGCIGSELSALGLDGDALVVLGGHDHICASVGAVIDSTEKTLHSTGTSEVLTTLFTGSDLTVPARRWLNVESSAHSPDNLVVGFCSASGQIHKSFSAAFARSDILSGGKLADSYESLGRRPVFLPPVRAMQTSVSGGLTGIPGFFDPDDLWRSLYEGFALECRRVLDRIESVTETASGVIRSVGGQSGNDGLTQLRSNIWNRPIERVHDPNISARGAFVVAGVASGLFSDVVAAAENFYENIEVDVFQPDARAAGRYRDFYENEYLTLFEDGIYSI